MQDVRWDLIKNCELLNVYQKLPTLYNTYIIELVNHKIDSSIPEYYKIKIQSYNLYNELKELKEGKKERCYFAYGMADIDVYKSGKKYIIMNSPTEAFYHEYELSEKEFDNILNALMPR
jgi:hypothetical protein